MQQKQKKNVPSPPCVIFGRGFPSAAVWSIPPRGYCSSFLINYFRQKVRPPGRTVIGIHHPRLVPTLQINAGPSTKVKLYYPLDRRMVRNKKNHINYKPKMYTKRQNDPKCPPRKVLSTVRRGAHKIIAARPHSAHPALPEPNVRP